jgi:hypothetical protein
VPTRYDLQRYKKSYAFIRRAPVLRYIIEDIVTIESAEASFNGSDTLTYSFKNTFINPPQVTATPKGTSANFSVFVVLVSNTSVTIRASVPNSDSIHIHVIEAA